ncbi:head maturation protease, ClpP-related [Paenibacillus apiarius]|uniref:head maturation protease, ClpP-related n=1 Tax=Paenibacillus apiarius TaxID=46240 RepID=UPI003B3B2A00
MKHKIKGDITSWNSSVWDFNYKMRSVKDDEDIELEINSYGGDVFAGIDMMNTLRGHKGTVTITVTGIAASAASVICMGADVLKMYSNTQLMLHKAWTIVAGNAKQLRKAADNLDSIGESVLASYTNRIDANMAEKLLDEETYLSASKAVELGLADEIIDVNPETVESEIFKDAAEQFNNKIVAFTQAQSRVSDDEFKRLKAQYDEMKNELEQLKSRSPKEELKPAAAAGARFLF